MMKSFWLKPISATILNVIIFVLIVTVSMAQDQIIQVNIVPQAEHAVAGDILTYNIEVTNVSDVPAGEVVVSAYVPEGTVFLNARNPEGWLVSNPVDGIGEFVLTADRMEVQETAVIELIVRVEADMVGEMLIVGATGDIGYENVRSQPEPESTYESVVVTATPTLNPQQIQATQTVVQATQAVLDAQATETAVASTLQETTATPIPVARGDEGATSETVENGGGLSSTIPCISGAIFMGLTMMLFLSGVVRQP